MVKEFCFRKCAAMNTQFEKKFFDSKILKS